METLTDVMIANFLASYTSHVKCLAKFAEYSQFQPKFYVLKWFSEYLIWYKNAECFEKHFQDISL